MLTVLFGSKQPTTEHELAEILFTLLPGLLLLTSTLTYFSLIKWDPAQSQNLL